MGLNLINPSVVIKMVSDLMERLLKQSSMLMKRYTFKKLIGLDRVDKYVHDLIYTK